MWKTEFVRAPGINGSPSICTVHCVHPYMSGPAHSILNLGGSRFYLPRHPELAILLPALVTLLPSQDDQLSEDTNHETSSLRCPNLLNQQMKAPKSKEKIHWIHKTHKHITEENETTGWETFVENAFPHLQQSSLHTFGTDELWLPTLPPRTEGSVSPAREGPFAQGTARSTCGPAVLGAESAVASWSSSARSWPGSQRCTSPGGHSRSWTGGSWKCWSEKGKRSPV